MFYGSQSHPHTKETPSVYFQPLNGELLVLQIPGNGISGLGFFLSWGSLRGSRGFGIAFGESPSDRVAPNHSVIERCEDVIKGLERKSGARSRSPHLRGTAES